MDFSKTMYHSTKETCFFLLASLAAKPPFTMQISIRDTNRLLLRLILNQPTHLYLPCNLAAITHKAATIRGLKYVLTAFIIVA